ncbi:MAG: hypothetical protein L6R28_14040 [Planctomycetes bacterium]|nr:hypothetical protein [Planctomycetota bacterium]
MDPDDDETLDAADEHQVHPQQPTERAKYIALLLLILFFISVTVASRIAPKLEEIFKEMELGELPVVTMWFLTFFNFPLAPVVYTVLAIVLSSSTFAGPAKTANACSGSAGPSHLQACSFCISPFTHTSRPW